MNNKDIHIHGRKWLPVEPRRRGTSYGIIAKNPFRSQLLKNITDALHGA